jgi:sterol desaturase/sphingolipid hydroxylase (fatty acid hydroxylase superfamily)
LRRRPGVKDDPVSMNLRQLLDDAPGLLPWALGLLALVLAASLLEGVVMTWWLRRGYDWRAFWASLGVSVGRRLFDAFSFSLAAPLFVWAYTHRLHTIPLNTVAAVAVLFVGQEFCYYWFHRASHRVRWFWATHAVHHSPSELTLAASLRLGWTGKITGATVFYVPLVWLGFAPQAVVATYALNLLYQFWLHTTWIPKLGPLEWVLNTPSHHRVHHGCNPEYLDCNYGGVLIVFDRLFGSFVAEKDEVPVRYGLTVPLASNNPLAIAFHEWGRMAQDVMKAPGWRAAVGVVFGPPGGKPKAPAAISSPSAVA